ncbi:MAG: hypothetical protein AAF830_13495 [Pseudomonadota bacterium]
MSENTPQASRTLMLALVAFGIAVFLLFGAILVSAFPWTMILQLASGVLTCVGAFAFLRWRKEQETSGS